MTILHVGIYLLTLMFSNVTCIWHVPLQGASYFVGVDFNHLLSWIGSSWQKVVFRFLISQIIQTKLRKISWFSSLQSPHVSSCRSHSRSPRWSLCKYPTQCFHSTFAFYFSPFSPPFPPSATRTFVWHFTAPLYTPHRLLRTGRPRLVRRWSAFLDYDFKFLQRAPALLLISIYCVGLEPAPAFILETTSISVYLCMI